ncbi:MAG: alkaline phosphatase, partial [Rubripirellula sp.]|nr:alkaline phosphatase [Rubripirellula sp.]
NHGVRNQKEIRAILEQADCVHGVFQGHSHQNDLKWINHIPYCTCVAMVEGSGTDQNAYSILDLHEDHSIQLRGFRKQASPTLKK